MMRFGKAIQFFEDAPAIETIKETFA